MKGGKFVDQKKVGIFLKALRKEKELTQEQLAEHLNVSGRTVSRWETGNNMPDLGILVEIADFYGVEIRELLEGERRTEKVNQEMEETVLKIADYSNEQKNCLMRKLHIFSWIGVITFAVFLLLEAFGLTDNRVAEGIASFCCGVSFGMLVIAVIYTSHHIYEFNAFKKRLIKRMGSQIK